MEGGAWGLVGRSSKCQAHGGKTNLNLTLTLTLALTLTLTLTLIKIEYWDRAGGEGTSAMTGEGHQE